MNITIEPGASALLDALHRAGFAAYVVGGCVRDSPPITAERRCPT